MIVEMFESAIVIILCGYIFFLLLLIVGWVKAKKHNQNKTELKEISVIIPYRNEEKQLENLTRSLSSLNYAQDKIEFIFVNDHSTDKSEEMLSELLLSFPFETILLSLKENGYGKKVAIQKAIDLATKEFIVTTDVDCMHPNNWLIALSSELKKDALLVAPVINERKKGLLSKFQEIESVVLAGMLISTAYWKKPLLCSGANMGYSKHFFLNINPYENNTDILSGDDMFFLDKVIATGNKVNYIASTDSTITTQPAPSFKKMLDRSVRWSSKVGSLQNKQFKSVGLLIAFGNLFFIIGCFFGCLGDVKLFPLLLCVVKILIDILFLQLLSLHYKRKRLSLYAMIMAFYYPFYAVIVTLFSSKKNTKWRERDLINNG